MVGQSAARRANSDERSLDVEKYENEQTYIMLLVAVALQAAFSISPEQNQINIDYIGSSALPMNEATDEAKKKEFVEKLINHEHTIVFLETPQLRGLTVNINFVNFIVKAISKMLLIPLKRTHVTLRHSGKPESLSSPSCKIH